MWPRKCCCGRVDRRNSNTPQLIVELVQEFPHEVRLLTLGPLTNLATAIELDPELPSQLEAAICLGGTNTAPGDVSAVAEFNIWCDPESAAMVFGSEIPRIAVPLDVSGSAMLTFEDVDVLTELISGTRHGEVLSSMLQFSLRANHQLAMEGIPLHGVVALAVAAKAEAYSLEAVRVDVETSGELTRGMTVVDRRPGYKGQTNVDLVSSVDELGVVDYFSRSLRRVAG